MKLEDGFLDLKLNEAIVAFRNEYKSEYALIFEIKSFLDEAQEFFLGKTVSKQDMFLSASILELNKLFQSAVLLFERGLPESSNIVIRSILELSFRIVELIRNDDFLKEMILDINSETLSTLKNIKKYELFDLVPQSDFHKLLNDCQQVESKKGKTDIRASILAKRNGLEKEYIIYRTYCDYTHQSVKVIDENVKIKPDGVKLNGDLRLDDFSESIAMLASITMVPFSKLVEHSLIDKNLKCRFDLLQEVYVKTFKNNVVVT